MKKNIETKTTKKIMKGETKVTKKDNVVSQLHIANNIDKIREAYGKNAIIIKGNLVFRTSTRVLEKGPKSLFQYYLPNYGKMRKFVVLYDGVYEIITDTIQHGTEFAQYTISDKVDMSLDDVNFDETTIWNKNKKAIIEK